MLKDKRLIYKNPPGVPKPEAERTLRRNEEEEERIPREGRAVLAKEADIVAEDISANKEGKLHTSYRTSIEALSKREVKRYRDKIKGSSIESIRYDSKLLREKSEKDPIKGVKQETLGRLAAYTNRKDELDYSEGWYTLNYAQHGYDKSGLSHEMNIGLGDILLDPDVKQILVEHDGEEAFTATRGIVASGKHAGRVGFVDSSGGYVATYTNDRFQILSSEEQPRETYIKDLETEEHARAANKEVYKTAQAEDLGQSIEWSSNLSGNIRSGTSDKYVEQRLDESVGNGANIMAYCKEVCKQFNIPWIIYKEIIRRESDWNPNARWKNRPGGVQSNAAGLGQFLSSTWTGFLKRGTAVSLDDRWGTAKGTKLGPEQRMNPYVNAYATAWMLKAIIKAFPMDSNTPLHEKAHMYYLAYHEGNAGAKGYLKFMNKMKEDGHMTKGEILAAYAADPTRYKPLLHKNQRGRIDKYGIQNIVNVYFGPARDVALRTAGHNPELFATKALPEEKETAGEKLKYNPKSTLILGASIMAGAAKSFPGKPDNKSKGGENILFIRKQFDAMIKKHPGKYKTIILSGGTGNGFPKEIEGGAGVSPAKIARAYTRIKKNFDQIFSTAKRLGIKVVVVTHPPWGKRLMDMAGKDPEKYNMLLGLQKQVSDFTMTHPNVDRVIPLHKEFADPNAPDVLAKAVGGRRQYWHLTGKGYKRMSARIMREFESA